MGSYFCNSFLSVLPVKFLRNFCAGVIKSIVKYSFPIIFSMQAYYRTTSNSVVTTARIHLLRHLLQISTACSLSPSPSRAARRKSSAESNTTCSHVSRRRGCSHQKDTEARICSMGVYIVITQQHEYGEMNRGALHFSRKSAGDAHGRKHVHGHSAVWMRT